MMGWKKTLGAALLSMACVQAWATTLTVTSTPDTTAPGSKISVAVNVADVTDLAAYQFSLNYDNSLLKFTDFSAGGFLGSGGAGTDQFYLSDDPGSISYVIGTIVGEISGVSGGGVLAYFTFETLGMGVSGLTLSDVLLLNSNIGDIATTVTGGSVAIEAPVTPPTGDVPEPASWMLMGVGLVAAGALRRRRVGAATAAPAALV